MESIENYSALRSDEGWAFLNRLISQALEVTTSNSLLRCCHELCRTALQPEVLGVFIWMPKERVAYVQQGLEDCFPLSERATALSGAGELAAQAEWAAPNCAVEPLQYCLSCVVPQYRIALTAQVNGGVMLALGFRHSRMISQQLLDATAGIIGLAVRSLPGYHIDFTAFWAETLESTSAQRRQFLRAFADLLESPLEVISNYLYIIDAEIQPTDPHKKYLQIVRQKLRLLGDVTQRLELLTPREP